MAAAAVAAAISSAATGWDERSVDAPAGASLSQASTGSTGASDIALDIRPIAHGKRKPAAGGGGGSARPRSGAAAAAAGSGAVHPVGRRLQEMDMANLMTAFKEKFPPPKSHLASLGGTFAVRLGEDGSSTAAAASALWETQLKPASDRWYALSSAYCDEARIRFARVPAVASLSLTMARRWVVAFAKQHPPEDTGAGETAGSAPGSRSLPQRELGGGGRGRASGSGRVRGAPAARPRRATAAAGVSKGARSRPSGRAALPPRRQPRRFGDLPSNNSDEGGGVAAKAPTGIGRRTRGMSSAGRSGSSSSSSSEDDRDGGGPRH
ncbi:hypothetical protein MMPV_006051 [Pyropia vietnamensis]